MGIIDTALCLSPSYVNVLYRLLNQNPELKAAVMLYDNERVNLLSFGDVVAHLTI